MKFARVYQESLQDGFPPHWVESAISYKQLKKCIKRVERELSDLGLDVETLNHLLRFSGGDEHGGSDAASKGKPFQYSFPAPPEPEAAQPEPSPRVSFQPKLLFRIDEESGQPIDASLSPETKNYLHQLALSQQLTDVRIVEVEEHAPMKQRKSMRPWRMIEIPLTADSEFFGTLQTQLSGLTALQREEQRRLKSDIAQLGRSLAHTTRPTRSVARHDLATWRKIFELYLDSRIFFATTEQDHGARDSAKAGRLLQKYSEQLRSQGLPAKLRSKESRVALHEFLRINAELLRSLRFLELNQTAMAKILKKFDKRTALGAKGAFPATLAASIVGENVAKAVCYQVSSELLTVVPQLDDYLCPVCFGISWRPIRLRCGHIFCIRCLVVMQRAREDHCPLCRGAVIMEADSTNLDPALVNFLKRYFPDEVKAKQRENERAAGVDQYGEAYNVRCCVM